MLIIQSILVGIFCYLGALSVPWPLGLITGWYTLTRPLVSGLILGIIFGDITQGVMIGAAVQAVYIALVTPGGIMPADLNFVAYPAMALAMVSNSTPEVAIAIAASLGILGTVIHNTMMIINSYWGVKSDKAIEEGNQKALFRSAILFPQLTTFLLRFVPSFLIVYLGAQFFQNQDISEMLPVKVIHTMTILGGVLPSLGIATLLVQIIHKDSLILYFLVGFIGVVFLKLNTLALLIIGLFLTFMYIEYSGNTIANNNTNEEEEF